MIRKQTMLAGFAAITAILVGAPATLLAQQQVRVVGSTTADRLLIKDTLQMIAQSGFARDGCRDIGRVSVRVLDDYVPSDEAYRTNTAIAYERWDVERCEKSETFLIAFTPAAEGGTTFKISFPPPDDLPPASFQQE